MKPNKEKEAALKYKQLTYLLSYFSDGNFRWNGKYDKIAGAINTDGYRIITINRRRYAAHRLAWFYRFRAWPENQLDHINGNKLDNRIDNLREATSFQNQGNKRKYRGKYLKGVSRIKNRAKSFRSQIRYNNKLHILGHFYTEQEAHARYLAEAKKIWGEFARAA